jgi:hypothetical protein
VQHIPQTGKQARCGLLPPADAAASRTHLAACAAAAAMASFSCRCCAHCLRSSDSEFLNPLRCLANCTAAALSAHPRLCCAPPKAAAAVCCWCHCSKESSCCWHLPCPCRRRCRELMLLMAVAGRCGE